MWHAVAPVNTGYDPILYESPEASNTLVLNAGPGNILLRAWPELQTQTNEPHISVELRPGEQRIVSGCLIRARLVPISPFAAIAWRLIPDGKDQ